MNDRELRKLKTELREHLDTRTRLGGKESALLERLKNEFDVESLKEAKRLLKKRNAELDSVTEKLQEALDKLEKREESDD